VDPIGWYIATLHNLLGHDKAAQLCGGPVGDKRLCVLCRYEAAPDDLKRQAVIRALRPAALNAELGTTPAPVTQVKRGGF
jgi:hypothetical protein